MNKKTLFFSLVILFTLSIASMTASAFACHITIIKVVIGSAPDQDFIITRNISTEHLYVNGTSRTFELTIGNYTINELLPDGWVLNSISIEDPTSDSYVENGVAYINLGDEGVTVTFFNSYRPYVGGEIISNNLRLWLTIPLITLVSIAAVLAIRHIQLRKKMSL